MGLNSLKNQWIGVCEVFIYIQTLKCLGGYVAILKTIMNGKKISSEKCAVVSSQYFCN